MYWTQFESIGHSLKNLGHSQKILPPPLVSQAGYGPENNCIIPFSNLTTLVLWKNIVFENREWQCYYSTLIIALSVFITICIFLDAYNIHKSSNNNFAPVKKQGFRWTKSDLHSNIE